MSFSIRPLRLCLWLCLLAPIACSSAKTSEATDFGQCADRTESAACPGKYSITCTGVSAAPADSPCDAPSVGPDGARTYCCGGCESVSDGACPKSVPTAKSLTCRGGAIPLSSSSSACLAADPNDDGTSAYCCLPRPEDGEGSAVTAPNLTCDSGSPVETYYSEPNVNLGCSNGLHLSGTYHYGYCCTAGSCAATKTSCSIGAITGTSHNCGAAYPSASDPSLVCGQGHEVDVPNSFDAYFSFCCAKVPPGKCKADPSVPDCIDPGLLGFSCTGSSTPRDQLPSLTCLAGTAGADGSTKYCCGG